MLQAKAKNDARSNTKGIEFVCRRDCVPLEIPNIAEQIMFNSDNELVVFTGAILCKIYLQQKLVKQIYVSTLATA